jgi:hypothetical protein
MAKPRLLAIDYRPFFYPSAIFGPMNLTGKTFIAVANSSHGTINTQTHMTFLSDDESGIVGVYSGGTVKAGQVVAQRTGDAAMNMLYHCITHLGELKAGQASAVFVQQAERLVVKLEWQWLTDDRASGQSEWILEP